MYAFFVEAYASTASFRLPEAHTFQQTLPLPPLTALLGLAGAALGLPFEQIMVWREEGLKCGVQGRSGGEASDLWKYRKIKSGEVISAVLTREILCDLRLKIAYAHAQKEKVERLRQAFVNPVYALSAGTSDDLIKVCRVSEVASVSTAGERHFSYTVLPGDQSANYRSAIKCEDLPLLHSVRAPRVFLLPVAFDFLGEERRVKAREHFTFVDAPVELVEPVPAISYEWGVFPLL